MTTGQNSTWARMGIPPPHWGSTLHVMTERAVLLLRNRLQTALRKDRLQDALVLYDQLERLEPDEPRWPHRKGDLLRRLDRNPAAVEAYASAVNLYAAQGFIARAVAMAKVVLGIDESRMDVLERADPEAARQLLAQKRSRPSLPAPESARDDPAERVSIPSELLQAVVIAPSMGSAQAAPRLTPAADAAHDEVRFVDGPSIELDLSDIEIIDRHESLPQFFLEESEERSASELALLPGSPLFAELPQEAMVALAKRCDVVELPDGAVLMCKGDPADSLYAIVEGSVRVLVPGLPREQAAVLAEGDVVGETCLLDGVQRRADVVVSGRLVALRVPKDAIDDMVQQHPPLGDVLFELLSRRVITNLFRTNELFAAFDREIQIEIARLFEVRRADEGTRIVQANKRSDGLYVLLVGRLTLETADGTVQELRPVTIFGHHSLISHEPSDFSIDTATEGLLLRLPAAAFTRLAAVFPPVLDHLATLAQRPLVPAMDGNPVG